MSHFKIKIAGLVANIKTIHIRPEMICRDFITDEEASFSVETNQLEIEKARREYKKVYNAECGLWDGVLEVTALLNKLVDILIYYDVVLMHGVAVSINGKAVIFSAPSGVGKTTHIRKWIDNCPGTFVINGDKPFVRIEENSTPVACGTPWAGKENIYTNIMAPLESIVLMERSEDNRIFGISFTDALPFLIQQTQIPSDPNMLKRTIELLARMKNEVRFYRFYFNNYKEDCFQVAYNALVNGVES